MAILVTGGAGFIGSHTCVELLEAGREIVLLDNFSNSKPEAIRRIKQITGRDFPVEAVDLLYPDGIRSVFQRHSIEAVIHFAGLKAVGESVELPLEYYHNNITGTLNLCRVMKEAGCRRLVFSSSATVYGENPNVPFTEEMPRSSTNPYGATKVMIEQILEDICASDPSWSAVLLRYFNPIGAHASGLLGEDPNGIPNNLFPFITQVATGKLPRLRVFGDDYDTPDGTGVRDYLHVSDLAMGHLQALDYAMEQTGALAINLGTGRGYSVLEVVHAFEKASGIAIPYDIVERRSGDIATVVASAKRANRLLGFSADRTLEQMCTDGWRFAKNNPNGL